MKNHLATARGKDMKPRPLTLKDISAVFKMFDLMFERFKGTKEHQQEPHGGWKHPMMLLLNIIK